MLLLSLELLLETLLASILLRLESLHCLTKVLRGGRALRNPVGQNDSGLGVYLESGSAAGTFDLENVLGHVLILAYLPNRTRPSGGKGGGANPNKEARMQRASANPESRAANPGSHCGKEPHQRLHFPPEVLAAGCLEPVEIHRQESLQPETEPADESTGVSIAFYP